MGAFHVFSSQVVIEKMIVKSPFFEIKRNTESDFYLIPFIHSFIQCDKLLQVV